MIGGYCTAGATETHATAHLRFAAREPERWTTTSYAFEVPLSNGRNNRAIMFFRPPIK
jgi:hypothetical protein